MTTDFIAKIARTKWMSVVLDNELFILPSSIVDINNIQCYRNFKQFICFIVELW